MLPNLLHTARPELLEALGIRPTAFDGARIAIVTGPNASGKSIVRRLFSYKCEQANIAKMHFSQQARSTSGFQRAFVYGGSEDEDATGQISCNAIVAAFRNMRKWEQEHVAIYDEPELGLSEEVQLGVAEFMRDQFQDWPPKCLGFIVMTHSRYIVRALKDLPETAFVNLGGQYNTADEWLARPIVAIAPSTVIESGRSNWHKFAPYVGR